MTIENLSPVAPTIGVGFFAGILIGYALKESGKDSSDSSWLISGATQ
jgi:uncharacterized membrane protein (Fun14 family)